MLKARCRGPRGPLVLLGLEPGNLDRLRAGHPLYVQLRELGLDSPIEIVVFYGESPQAMLDDLRRQGVDVPPLIRPTEQ